jgi:RimJ/RimL family protein N-acetyltransferase
VPLLPESLTLRGEGVMLRDWREPDARAIAPVCGDPDVCQFTTVPWAYTLADARAWIARLQVRRRSGTGLTLAITNNDEDLPIGSVSLVRFSDAGLEAALGYWLAPAVRGQGLAIRAARLLSGWGFRELQLERIELAILPDNTASQAVADGLGATREGLRPDSHEADGRRWDMVIYSLTAHPPH